MYVLCDNHPLPVYSRGYMGSDTEERIECKANTTAELDSAYNTLREQLNPLVKSGSSIVSGI